MDFFVEIIKTNGVVAAIAVYMIFQSRKDYKGVCDRLNEVEDYVKVKMFAMIKTTTEVIDRNSNILEGCPGNTKTKPNSLFDDD